jgi:hypothetical protein
MSKRVLLVPVMIAFLAGLSPTASAQQPGEVDLHKTAAPKQKALVGSWLETVTFAPETGRPPLESLGTFHSDGTMVCSDQGAVTVTAEPTGVFTPCHGVWTEVGKLEFAYTSLALISDLSGHLVGYLKVRGTYTVAQSGNAYSGNSLAEILDADGNVLFSFDVTNAGQRIQIGLP